MVLMSNVCEDRPEALPLRPRLVLQDFSQEQPCSLSQKRAVSRPRRRLLARAENVLLASAASAAIGYFVLSSASSLIHSVQQNYSSPALPRTVIISKVVKRGDTLTSLARRYGNPNTYILQREDQIARANHLTGTPLLPGQHLEIPVTNPSVIAQIVRSSHHHLLASR